MDLGLILASSFIASIIIGWIVAISKGIVYFVAFIMCIGKRNCKIDDCHFRAYCTRTTWSDKEKDIIRKKIEELGDLEEDSKKDVS